MGANDHQKPSGRVGKKSPPNIVSQCAVLVVRDRANAFRPKTAHQNEEACMYSAAEQEGSARLCMDRPRSAEKSSNSAAALEAVR
jgi:hypothetical protein